MDLAFQAPADSFSIIDYKKSGFRLPPGTGGVARSAGVV